MPGELEEDLYSDKLWWTGIKRYSEIWKGLEIEMGMADMDI